MRIMQKLMVEENVNTETEASNFLLLTVECKKTF
jgi:hypothetical protein